MTISFTGTRHGMTSNQLCELDSAIHELSPTLVLHGNCIGADTDFHKAILAYSSKILIEVYPCDIEDQQSNCCHTADIINPIMRPLIRNRLMVDRSDMLIACPHTMEEEQRGGTWYTIRYARKVGKKLVILRPVVSTLEEIFYEESI